MYTDTVSISTAAFCRLLLHRGERETRVTGDERQGTSGYEADIKAPNVPAHPKETLGTKFERKVRTILCTTTPSPQTKSGRQTSLSPILLEERRWSFKG